MKKGLYAILAALAVFALVMTGCDTGGGGDDPPPPPSNNVTITFNLNGGPGTAPGNKTITKGGSLGTDMPDPMATGIADLNGISKIWTFNGWFNKATAGTEVDGTTKFPASATVWAQWDHTLDAPPTGSVAVIFNYNWPITGGPSATSVNVISGGKLTANDLGAPIGNKVPTKYKFSRWNTKADGTGTDVTTSIAISVTSGALPLYDVYAIWAELWTVTYDLRGGTVTGGLPNGDLPPVTGLETGAKVTKPVTDPTKANDAAGSYTFNGWFKEISQTHPWDFDKDTVTRDLTIYAGWTWTPSTSGANAPKEKVTLSNANHVIYYFELSGNQKWSDYETLTAEYMLETYEEFDVPSSARAIRVYGNYEADFFQFNTTTKGNKYAYATLDGTINNNGYILAQAGGGSGVTLASALTTLTGSRPDPKVWFTVTYDLTGGTKNGSFNPRNMPDANATGPFILGIGLPGQDDKNTIYIKDVKMKAKGANNTTNDVVGQPLYIKKKVDGTDTEDYDYPAFSAYGTAEGNGVDNIGRTLYDPNHKKVITAVDRPTYTIKFDQNLGEGTDALVDFAWTVDANYPVAFNGTATVEKYRTLPYPTGKAKTNSSLPKPDMKIVGWFVKDDEEIEVTVGADYLFFDDTIVYAIWEEDNIPDATADLVITPDVASFGGLGAQNNNAGNGPFLFNAKGASDGGYQYDAMLWFGLTNAVATAKYKSIKVEFTAVKVDGTADVDQPGKLTFHLGRAAGTYDGGTQKYVDVQVADVNAGNTQTQIWDLDDATIEKGILIQHNRNGNATSTFNFTITKITLLKP